MENYNRKQINNDALKKTIRLTFSYEGSEVKLDSVQHIRMIPPPPQPYKIEKGQSGFWFEIQDENQRVLYQRSLHNPIKFDVEVHGNSINEPSTRHKLKSPKGIFEILSPDLDNGYSIVLFSSPLGEQEFNKPASELARFNLKPNNQEDVK